MTVRSIKCSMCNEQMTLVGRGLILVSMTELRLANYLKKLFFGTLNDEDLDSLYFCPKCNRIRSLVSFSSKKHRI